MREPTSKVDGKGGKGGDRGRKGGKGGDRGRKGGKGGDRGRGWSGKEFPQSQGE